MYRSVCVSAASLALLVLILVVPGGRSCPRSCNCYQANEVHCTFRSLLTVPPGLPAHTRRINLGFNSINRLHDTSFVGLKKVELLMLHSNDLHHLPDEAFRDMKSLQILKLSYNKLREISSSLTFSGLTSLLRLYLDHNLLQHIHPRALLQLPSLRLLRLQGNRLHQLHPHTLCTLSLLNTYYFSTLRHLDLSNNSLTTLPKDTLSTAPLLETLVLQANPWSCDCRMSWLLTWSLAHPGLMKCPGGPQCPVCDSPNSLQGHGLLEQTALLCSSPVILSTGKETHLETDPSEILTSETFREPLGSVSLGLSDEQGNSVALSCNITHSSDSQDIAPLPDLSLASSAPLPLALSLTLKCPMERQSYEKLWRILAYYSETAVRLEREIMLSKAPALAYRYRQAAETIGYYHTGVRASVKARPHWLLQTAISIQLNRAQSNGHKVQLIYSTRVSAHPDASSHVSSSSAASQRWVLMSSNHTTTALAAVPRSKVELSCPLLSSGNPKVQWILPDGSRLIPPSSSPDGRLRASASGLLLQRVRLSDAGIYYCVAWAGKDVDVLPLHLAVEGSSVPPSGEEVEPPFMGTVEDPISLPCMVSGSPEPYMSWILPDGNLIRQGLAVSGGLTIESNGSLSLPNPSLLDAGHYRCIAVNQYGSDSRSVQLILNSQQIPSLRAVFPRGPQSASGRSTRIRAPLLGQVDEASGDGEEEEERTVVGNKRRPISLQPTPNRRYPIGNPRRRGPIREGHLRRGGGPVSSTDQRRNRFQNRHRVATNKQRIDPQKWADLLAKIRQKTAHTNNSQPMTTEKPTTEPVRGGKDKDTRGHEGDEDAEGAEVEAETEGSSVDDTVLQEEELQPVQTVQSETQTKMETKTDVNTEIETSTEHPTEEQIIIDKETETPMQTEKAGPQTETPTNPVTQKEPVTSNPMPGTNETVKELAEGNEQGANPSPPRTRPQNPRQGLFPNLVPNVRPQSPGHSRRKIGQRRRIINRTRGQPLTPPQPLPDPVNPRSQTVTPDTSTDRTNMLLLVSTTTAPAILLTPSDQIKTAPNLVVLNPVSPPVSRTPGISTSKPASPSLPPSLPHTNTDTHADMMTHSDKITDGEESSLLNTPAPTHSDIWISETHVPDTHSGTFTHGRQTHTETQTVLDKHVDRPSSKHDEERERTFLSVPNESHSSTTHSSIVSSVPRTDTTATAKTITTPSVTPRRAHSTGSTCSTKSTSTTTVTPLTTSPTVSTTTTTTYINASSTTRHTTSSATSTTTTTTTTTTTPILTSTTPTTTSTAGTSTTSTTADTSTAATTTSTTTPPTTAAATSTIPFNGIPRTVNPITTMTSPPTSKTTTPPPTTAAATSTIPFNGIPRTVNPTTTMTSPPTSKTTTPPPATAAATSTIPFNGIPRTVNPTTTMTSPPTSKTTTPSTSTTTTVSAKISATTRSATPSTLSSTTTTLTSTVTKASSRERSGIVQVDPKGRLGSGFPSENRPSTDWKNPGANSIPDSHSSRSQWSPSPSLPAAPVAPVLRSRPRIADPHIRTVSFPAESTARLDCEAEGEPKPSITWTKVATGAVMSVHSRAQRFEVLPNGTLVIQNVQLQDRGTYICSAHSYLGRDRLLTTLEVWTRPPRMQLASYREVTIHQGGEVRLECQADGVPTPLLSWVLPDRSVLTSAGPFNRRITMDTNGTLHISVTLQSDRGAYRCVASNSAGAASASVRVHVSSLPPVIQQPREEHLLLSPGRPVYAHCSARGAPPPTLRWRIPDGTLVRPSQFLHGNLFVLPNGTLHIRKVGLKESGSYECMASNAVGAVKRTVKVEIEGGAEGERRQGVAINEGTKAVATEKPPPSVNKDKTLAIPGYPSGPFSSNKFSPPSVAERSRTLSLTPSFSRPLSYPHQTNSSNSFPKIHKTVTASPTHFTNIRKKDPSSPSLTSTVATNNTRLSPSINITRVISSFPTDRRAPAVLHPSPVSPFSKARIVSTSPSVSTVHYGGILQLHCTVTGNPAPIIIWRTPNRKLVDMHFSFDRRLKVHPNGTLLVQSVTEKDAGDYLCIARNKVADDYRLLRVSVATKPAKIEPKQPLNQMVSFGKPLKVDCQASGLPDPAVHWSLPDGTMVNSVLHGEDRGGRARRLTVFDNGTLLVPAVGLGEEGEYTCYAENQGGQDTMKVKVKVMRTSPPAFTNDRSYHVTKVRQGATATIPCRATGDPTPTVTWFSPANRVIPQSIGSGYYSERVVVVSGGTLEVRMAQKIDTGNYTCRASNSAGGKSMVVGLEVEASAYGQSGGRGGAINSGSSRSGENINNGGIIRSGFTSGITNKLGSNYSSYHSDNSGRIRNIVPNTNLAISGSNPAPRRESGLNRPVSGITTQLGSSVISAGVNGARNVGIKDRNTPDIINSSNSVGNGQSTGRGESVERNLGTSNNEVIAEKASNDANASRDYSRLSGISRDVGGFGSSVSNNGAATSTLRGNGFSRSSNLEENRRNSGGSSSSTSAKSFPNSVVGVVTTVKQRAVKGQTVLLPCPSQGSPPPRLAWFLPGNGMLPAPYYGSRLTVHRNGSLELRGVRASDGGTLICVVRSERGEMTIRVELQVSDSQEEARSPQRGQTLERPAGLIEVPQLNSARSLNSRPAPPVVPHPRIPVTQKPLQRGLSLPAAPHPVGPPPFTGPASEPAVTTTTAPLVSIINGETLRLPCPEPPGHLKGSLSWTMPSGKVLSRGESGDSRRYSVQEDGTITVLQASVFDRGTYTCRSTSYDSSLVSVATVPVIVIAYPPRITTGPPPVTYTHPGVAVELPCLTTATPRATLTWETPDLTQLRAMDQPRIYGNRYLNPQGSLVIQNPTGRDTGFYKCTAKNVIGVDTKTTYLHVI
ncbi:immunoglobulin superfamily member 10-like [Acanthochromis polyacanthus]|uniref:immunoglobulin superfamily member 10-like n=1 Tax=Acanthochromis polyacanthus TaxID=80966 RepID=UPI0022349570|nr:immunoglobulin superfamily member 10-like [Acanthochromis polyacanthus]XP_051815160.1 immunoglobulin superfamily member 10-like [Acanthochromis polyacanthus]